MAGNYGGDSAMACEGKAFCLVSVQGRPLGTGLGELRTAAQVVAALKRCSKMKDLERGKSVHRDAIVAGFDRDSYVAASLIAMYSKCGSMALAQEVFDRMNNRNVVSWTSLVLGYAENGQSSVAMELFSSMDCEPNSYTFVAALKACGGLASASENQKMSCLEKGIAIHKEAKDRGLDSNEFVATTLVDMYCKCGSMDFAREVFDGMVSKHVVTWNCLILGYRQNGDCLQALNLFSSMDCKPNPSTYMAVLNACGGLASENESEKHFCLEKGIAIHKEIKDRGFDSNIVVRNALMDMYSSCGKMDPAREVFNKMVSKNVVSWSTLIHGYAQNGKSSLAMELFASMDCEPDSFTYVSALKACASLASEKESEKYVWLEKGIAIHKQVKALELASNTFVASSLVEMYTKCGNMDCARDVFDWMASKTVITWNCIILGYVEQGKSLLALDLISSMDCEADSVTYIAAFKACASLASDQESEKQFCLEKGIAIHKQARERGFESSMFVAGALMDMYSKCGSVERAKEVFDGMVPKNVVFWTTLILGYVQSGQNSVAMDLFTSMDCEPNSFTYTAALKACRGLACEKEAEKGFCLERGTAIHKQIKRRGFDSDIVVATTLLDMYCSCGSMDRAREVFKTMVIKDAVVWNTLVLGYLQNGQNVEAVELLSTMDCEPDFFTHIVAFKAWGTFAALRRGQEVHARVCRLGLEQDRLVVNSMIEFYGKCSGMNSAEELLNNIQCPGIVSWNALLAGYSFSGDSSQVFRLAREIEEAGLEIDGMTYTSILTACSHEGLLEEGQAYFEKMQRQGIKADAEHYNCLIDMLGRANRLKEALRFLMNIQADTMNWKTLLGACRRWKNLEVGKVAFDALATAGKTDAADYVLLRDIYISLGMRRDQLEKRKQQEQEHSWWSENAGRTVEWFSSEGDKTGV